MYLADMNPREAEDAAFDKLADGELRRLDRPGHVPQSLRRRYASLTACIVLML